MKEQTPVSGSIVLYKNNADVLKPIRAFLDSPICGRLYLIDNSPTDELKNMMSDLLNDERVEYIFNDENTGFGAGHNIALRKSIAERFPYHFIFNPDIHFDPQVIETISHFMDKDTHVGLVMPKVLYENGDTQYICKLLPTPVDFFVKRFLPKLYSIRQRDRFEMRISGYDKIMDVPFLSGCFMAFRREAIEQCGMFDERYFMYAEDIDLTRRIYQKFRTVFYPYVFVIHGYEAASYKSVKMFLVLFINISRYFFKWGWIWDKDRERINNEVLASLPPDPKNAIAG